MAGFLIPILENRNVSSSLDYRDGWCGVIPQMTYLSLSPVYVCLRLTLVLGTVASLISAVTASMPVALEEVDKLLHMALTSQQTDSNAQITFFHQMSHLTK